MIVVMTMCIGMSIGVCHQHVTQEYPSMDACMKDRDYQRKNNIDVRWVICKEVKKP